MSRMRPCFLKMPAICPTSETDVSQLPRWPTASLSASCPAAAVAEPANVSANNKPASASRLLMTSSEFSAAADGLAGALERRLAAPAEAAPRGGLPHHALKRADRG